MKSLKLVVINALTLLVGLGLMTSSLSENKNNGAKFDLVPALQVKNLAPHRGQYLHVIYAVGSKPFLASGSGINISQIKEMRTLYISGDMMPLTAVQVAKEGFRPSYNMVVIAVSEDSHFSWKNADGTIPQGGSAKGGSPALMISTISKSEIEDFTQGAGESAILRINMKRKSLTALNK